MPHVVFVHGLSNKPQADYLHQLWKRKLAHDDGLDLDNAGVTTSMVYWADVMYSSPDEDLDSYESATGAVEALEATRATTLSLESASPAERVRVRKLMQRLELSEDDLRAPPPLDASVAANVRNERIPMPPFVRKRVMAELVRDAHDYFYDQESRPRPGESYRVQTELRRRFVDDLTRAAQKSGPLVVVSHSMGTIIAYDCLRNVQACPAIDVLVTIGSPLGLDEVQDFFPNYDARDAFPGEKLRGAWLNVFDRLDVVAMLDPEISNDFQQRGRTVVRDIAVTNSGYWRHSISKYMQRDEVRRELREILGV